MNYHSFSQESIKPIDMEDVYPIISIEDTYNIVNIIGLSYIKGYKAPKDDLYKFNSEDNKQNIESYFVGLELKLRLFFNDNYREQSFFDTMKYLEYKISLLNDIDDINYYSKVYATALFFRQKSVRLFGIDNPNNV